MFYRIAILILLSPLGITAAAGCDANKDCVELCEEGQAGDCTAIDGSCSAFCSALDSVQEPAGCTGARESYEDCLNGEADVCDASCGASESSLTQCIVNHCVGDPSNGDCQTLASSF